jgi:hypothetical protein
MPLRCSVHRWASWVTWLGEFSYIGWLFFLWAIFWKITDEAHIFVILAPSLSWCVNRDKNVLGYILGDFLASSSGHPVSEQDYANKSAAAFRKTASATSNQGCQIFSCCNICTKTGNHILKYHKITKWPWNIPNCLKIFKMARKYTNIFLSEVVQNISKLGVLVCKYNIWQPGFQLHFFDNQSILHLFAPSLSETWKW